MTRKFAGLKELQNPLTRNSPATRPEAEAGGYARPDLPTEPPEKKGKRNNPEWDQKNVLLRKSNVREAKRRLADKYRGTDFSMLIDALLEQWLRLDEAS